MLKGDCCLTMLYKNEYINEIKKIKERRTVVADMVVY